MTTTRKYFLAVRSEDQASENLQLNGIMTKTQDDSHQIDSFYRFLHYLRVKGIDNMCQKLLYFRNLTFFAPVAQQDRATVS